MNPTDKTVSAPASAPAAAPESTPVSKPSSAADARLHFTKRYGFSLSLATAGGFLESYTYVTRGGIFANAQTGNIARMGIFLAQGEFLTALRYFVPVVAFMAGVTLSMQLKRLLPEHPGFRLSGEQLVILLELPLLGAVGLIPPDRLDVPATVLVSFVCALQVEGFRTFGDNAFASTMCTGNLRSATENLNRYFNSKDPALLKKSLQYFGIDVIFATGVMIGYWATRFFGTRAVWWTILVLAALFLRLTHEINQVKHV